MISPKSIYDGITGVWETTYPHEADGAIRDAGHILLAVGVDPHGTMHYALGRREIAAPTEFDALEAELRTSDKPLAKQSLQAVVYLRRRVKDLEEEAEMLARNAMDANERAAHNAGANR